MIDLPQSLPTIDVLAEAFAATKQVRQAHIDRLLAIGIPGSALAAIGADRPGIGALAIRALPDGLFEPDTGGQVSLIVPVCEYRSQSWCGIDLSQFEPIDLIAFRTGEPEQWLWRTGRAWALGVEHLEQDAPLRVVATPLDWIAAEGRAICILDWSAPGWCWELVRSELQLILPSDRMRQRLCNALVRNAALPDMEVSHAA